MYIYVPENIVSIPTPDKFNLGWKYVLRLFIRYAMLVGKILMVWSNYFLV